MEIRPDSKRERERENALAWCTPGAFSILDSLCLHKKTPLPPPVMACEIQSDFTSVPYANLGTMHQKLIYFFISSRGELQEHNSEKRLLCLADSLVIKNAWPLKLKTNAVPAGGGWW